MITTRQIQAIIKEHQKAAKREYPLWDKWRMWYQARWAEPADGSATVAPATTVYATDAEDGGESSNIETNYPYAHVDTMVANVVPPNPAVTVTARAEGNASIAKARERVILDTFRQQRFHSKLWALATRASVFPRAFVKVSWDVRKHRPKIRVIDPRYVWFDMGADSWDDIRYLIEVTPLTREEFMRRVKGPEPDAKGYDPGVVEKLGKWSKGLPKWLKDIGGSRADTVAPAEDVFETIVVYEVYDFTVPNGRFLAVIEDVPEPLFEGDLPYRFLRNPFHMLTFNDNLDDLGGMSDIQLVEGLINQANELDVLDLNFVKTAIPVAWVNTTVLKDPESVLNAYGSAGEPGSYVPIQVDQGVPLDQVIKYSPSPTLNPAHMRMESRLEDKILYILATPKYSRGSVGTGDVATEFALADGATRTRNARRQAEVYDIVGWAGDAVISLYEEYLTTTSVLYARVTGEDAVSSFDRKKLGMLDIMDGEFVGTRMEFDYEAVPYNATENNKAVQLRNIQQVWAPIQFGIQAKSIDGSKVLRRLLELVNMEDVWVEAQPEPAPEPMQPGGVVATGQPDLLDVDGLPDLNAPLGGGAMGVTQADTTPYMLEGGPGHGGGGEA